jgi:hypothetical protein
MIHEIRKPNGGHFEDFQMWIDKVKACQLRIAQLTSQNPTEAAKVGTAPTLSGDPVKDYALMEYHTNALRTAIYAAGKKPSI